MFSDSGQPATATVLGAENEKALINLNSKSATWTKSISIGGELIRKGHNLFPIPDLLNPSKKVPGGTNGMCFSILEVWIQTVHEQKDT